MGWATNVYNISFSPSQQTINVLISFSDLENMGIDTNIIVIGCLVIEILKKIANPLMAAANLYIIMLVVLQNDFTVAS